MEIDIINEFHNFISDLESRLKALEIAFGDFPVDHVCYRISSLKEYPDFFNLFKSRSLIYTTKNFHERLFHLFALRHPLNYKSISVPYVEFSQPGGSDNYNTGFQHIEFHSNLKAEELISDHGQAAALLYKGKYDGEAYLKWPDKICLKMTRQPIITKSLLEDNSEIFIL